MEINYNFIHWKDNTGKINYWHHENSQTESFCDTIGIWLPATSGIQMVNMCPIAEWSGNQIAIWMAHKKSPVTEL